VIEAAMADYVDEFGTNPERRNIAG